MSRPYIVIDAPGYYGDEGKVYSEHASLHAAIVASKRHEYTDERGNRRCPTAVAHNPQAENETYHAGGTFWRDAAPTLVR